MYYRPFSIADYEDVAIFSKPLYVFRSWLSVVMGRGGGGGVIQFKLVASTPSRCHANSQCLKQ